MSTLRHHRRRARHGFTLVELMISLVMGLIVSLAAVGLAQTATNTFHEQARSSVTEMTVRSAAERLRQDLTRISYMSTGNISLDPKLARRADSETPAARARYPSSFVTLHNLQGVRVLVGGSKAATEGPNKLAENNGLNPDAIEITGNLTTDDAYNGTISTSTGGCGAQVVRLDPKADAAVYTLLGGDDGPSTETRAKNAFLPGTGPFLAQITDPMGCNHYAPVCAVTADPTTNIIFVHLVSDGTRAVLYSHSDDTIGLANNCGASEGGAVTIAPIARVRWQLEASAGVLDSDSGLEAAGNKFDLTRQLIDANGDASGAPEVIAEYAVDLKFGLTVWDPTLAATSQPPVRVFDFDDATSAAAIEAATAPVSGAVPGVTAIGPQHVRSVRFRIATRTSMADRKVDVLSEARPYMARYCVEDQELATCKRFSRVRTLVSEVALQNQARMFY